MSYSHIIYDNEKQNKIGNEIKHVDEMRQKFKHTSYSNYTNPKYHVNYHQKVNQLSYRPTKKKKEKALNLSTRSLLTTFFSNTNFEGSKEGWNKVA